MLSNKRLALVHVVVLVLLSVCCVGCSRSALLINADKSYDGRTVNLRVGDGVKLTLEENPTTGYRWEFTSRPEPACVIVKDEYVANANGLAGSGGVHDWDFRAVDKGTCSMSLVYQRPWEKDTAPARKFALTIAVK
ncbi:MAG: protease inhibitor I42 family protein [Acidobacteria bacterium]|nr:protease inhibitor I42 family protein [Acidobacteriota bacterium]